MQRSNNTGIITYFVFKDFKDVTTWARFTLKKIFSQCVLLNKLIHFTLC